MVVFKVTLQVQAPWGFQSSKVTLQVTFIILIIIIDLSLSSTKPCALKAFNGLDESPTDAILLSKQWAACTELSQPPMLILPVAALSKLPKTIKAVNRVPITTRTRLEFEKTARTVSKAPWSLLRAADYIDKLIKKNKANQTSCQPLVFVNSGPRIQPSARPRGQAPAGWEQFAPGEVRTIEVVALPAARRKRLAQDTLAAQQPAQRIRLPDPDDDDSWNPASSPLPSAAASAAAPAVASAAAPAAASAVVGAAAEQAGRMAKVKAKAKAKAKVKAEAKAKAASFAKAALAKAKTTAATAAFAAKAPAAKAPTAKAKGTAKATAMAAPQVGGVPKASVSAGGEAEAHVAEAGGAATAAKAGGAAARFGCGRCRQSPNGCSTCKRPGYSARDKSG
jgi:hypothetical protein